MQGEYIHTYGSNQNIDTHMARGVWERSLGRALNNSVTRRRSEHRVECYSVTVLQCHSEHRVVCNYLVTESHTKSWFGEVVTGLHKGGGLTNQQGRKDL